MDPFGFGRIIADKWDVVLTYPGLFGAVFGLGLVVGIALARIFLNERLVGQQNDIVKLRAILEDKLPPSFLPQPKRSRTMSFTLVLGGISLAFIGLAVATVGILLRPQSTSPATQPLATEAPAPQPAPTADAAGRPLPKDPYQPGPIIQRKLTRKEAEHLIDALGDLNKVALSFMPIDVPQGLLPPLAPLYRFQRVPWFEQIRKDGIDKTINTLSTVRDQFTKASTSISQITNADVNYSLELNRVVGNTGLGNIAMCLDSFINALQELERNNLEDPSAGLISLTLAGPANRCAEIMQDYWRWRATFTQDRLQAARREIEAFL